MNCDELSGRLRDICRGHDGQGNLTISPEKREAYLKLFAGLPAPPVRQQNMQVLVDTKDMVRSAKVRLDKHGVPQIESMQAQPKIGFRYTPEQFPCEHRGEVLRIENCKLCGGREAQAEVFACTQYGECTVGQYGLNLKNCVMCAGRVHGLDLEG